VSIRVLGYVARCTVRMISGVPITLGSAQASGLAQFTTKAAVTNDRYDPHISRMCQPSQPDECRRRTAHPASAAASVATAISLQPPQSARGERRQT